MTGTKVFEVAMAMIDEVPEAGVFDADQTADYKNKAPYLLTELQNEICRIVPLLKTVSITASGEDGYVKFTKPTDYIALQQIVDSDFNNYNDFKKVGEDLYLPKTFEGTIVYKYQPTAIASLDDEIPFSEYIAKTVLTCGLAAQLMLHEKASVASYFNQKYEELKEQIKTQEPASTQPIKDVYDCSLSY